MKQLVFCARDKTGTYTGAAVSDAFVRHVACVAVATASISNAACNVKFNMAKFKNCRFCHNENRNGLSVCDKCACEVKKELIFCYSCNTIISKIRGKNYLILYVCDDCYHAL